MTRWECGCLSGRRAKTASGHCANRSDACPGSCKGFLSNDRMRQATCWACDWYVGDAGDGSGS